MGRETKGRGRQTVTLHYCDIKEDGRSGGLRGPVARAGGLQGAELRWP